MARVQAPSRPPLSSSPSLSPPCPQPPITFPPPNPYPSDPHYLGVQHIGAGEERDSAPGPLLRLFYIFRLVHACSRRVHVRARLLFHFGPLPMGEGGTDPPPSTLPPEIGSGPASKPPEKKLFPI